MKIITINPNKCVGCLSCSYECSYTRTGEFNTQDSNIRVSYFAEESFCIPFTCVQCSKAWCMDVCPANAITRNQKTGAVEINKHKCIGCKMGMMACPTGSIHFDTQSRVSAKCDLCGGDPICVRRCISGALRFEDESKAYEFKRNHIDNIVKRILK